MTEQERQKLCADLCDMEFTSPERRRRQCREAVEEIKRLAAANKRLENKLRLWREQG